jgi:hypothetical protein
VTASAPPLTAAAALAVQQDRVAGLLARAGGRPLRLSPSARRRLVGLGHFPAYAAELDWTPHEVAGHLRDSARVFTDRIGRIGREDRPALPDFVPDEPARVAGYRTVPTTGPARRAGRRAGGAAGLRSARSTPAGSARSGSRGRRRRSPSRACWPSCRATSATTPSSSPQLVDG